MRTSGVVDDGDVHPMIVFGVPLQPPHVRSRVRAIVMCGALAVVAGCLPSDPGGPERMVISRDGSTISFFEVGCVKTSPVARQVTVAVRRPGSPIFSTSGRFVLQGKLDDSGVLVVGGGNAKELREAVAAASDDERLVFVGDEVLATRKNRFEFSWPIAAVRR